MSNELYTREKKFYRQSFQLQNLELYEFKTIFKNKCKGLERLIYERIQDK